MSTLIMWHNRFRENENEAVEAHIPRHRDSKTKKPRHRETETINPGHCDLHFFRGQKATTSSSCGILTLMPPDILLRSCLYERTRRDKKARTDDKTEKENLFHCFFIELLLGHVTVNETGAFGIPPDKGNRVQYFVPFLFISNQFISKQPSHVKSLMST